MNGGAGRQEPGPGEGVHVSSGPQYFILSLTINHSSSWRSPPTAKIGTVRSQGSRSGVTGIEDSAVTEKLAKCRRRQSLHPSVLTTWLVPQVPSGPRRQHQQGSPVTVCEVVADVLVTGIFLLQSVGSQSGSSTFTGAVCV